MQDAAQKIVDGALDRLNELLPPEQSLSKDPSTPLLSGPKKLDSMGFVNLLSALEEEIEAQLGKKIYLSDSILGPESVNTVGDLQRIIGQVIATAQ